MTPTPAQAADSTTTRIDWTDDGGALSFRIGGTAVACYAYRPDDGQYESPRPYFHPLRTLGGDTVTIFRPWDHTWHKGISWALPNVGPHNFWGGATYTRATGYADLDNNGTIRHDAFDAIDDDGHGATAAESLTWSSLQGETIIEEKRRFGIRVLDDTAWVLLFETAMTNIGASDLSIGSPTTEGRDNAGYGGLFWRGPRAFTGGTALSPDATSAEELRGSRDSWLSFTGQHDEHGRHSSLTFVEDAANPGFPNQWFVRSEPFACIGSAPFFSAEVFLPVGGSLTYRFAVVIADGAANREIAASRSTAAKDALAEWGPRS